MALSIDSTLNSGLGSVSASVVVEPDCAKRLPANKQQMANAKDVRILNDLV
jgi:hypothetical protein